MSTSSSIGARWGASRRPAVLRRSRSRIARSRCGGGRFQSIALRRGVHPASVVTAVPVSARGRSPSTGRGGRGRGLLAPGRAGRRRSAGSLPARGAEQLRRLDSLPRAHRRLRARPAGVRALGQAGRLRLLDRGLRPLARGVPRRAWASIGSRWWCTTGARWAWPPPSACTKRLERLVVINTVPFLPGYRLAPRARGSGAAVRGRDWRWGSTHASGRSMREASRAGLPSTRSSSGRTSTTAPSARSSSSTARRRPRCSRARARPGRGSTALRWCSPPARDPYIRPEFGAAYAEALGERASCGELEGAGHWPWLDRPELIDAWRRSWLARLERVPAKRLLAVLMAAFALAGCNGNDESEDAERTSATAGPRGDPDRGRAGDRAAAGPTTKTVATGLEAPWELAFLPGRAGAGHRAAGARAAALEGPEAARTSRWPRSTWRPFGESGLLGLAVDPEFEQQQLRLPLPHHRLGQRGAALPLRGRPPRGGRRRCSTASQAARHPRRRAAPLRARRAAVRDDGRGGQPGARPGRRLAQRQAPAPARLPRRRGDGRDRLARATATCRGSTGSRAATGS